MSSFIARQTLVHLVGAAILLGAQPQARVLGEAVSTVSSGGQFPLRDAEGAVWGVQLGLDATVMLVDPGAKDLSGAVPAPLASIKPGDRLLVRGAVDNGLRTVIATSVVVMSKDAVEAARAREQADWRAKSLAGTVVSADAAAGVVVLRVAQGTALGMVPAKPPGAAPSTEPGAAQDAETKEWTISMPAAASLMRYSDDSIRFADARPAKLEDVRPGDQMRVLGERDTPAGTAVAAKALFGSFRTLGGEITRVDAARGVVTMRDVQTRKPVTLRINGGANLRRMPSAQGFMGPAGMGPPGMGMRAAPPGSGPGGGGPRRPDMQQMLDRLPALTLADLQPGDAVIVSAGRTSGPQPWPVVSLVAGVDSLLRAPAAQVNQTLGNWSTDLPMQ